MPTRRRHGTRLHTSCPQLQDPTTSRPVPGFSGSGSWVGPFSNTAHRRIPSEGVSGAASPSGFRPHPLVPGLFSFRARVILLADGPTRPQQRLPVPEQALPFPPPEPPLLLKRGHSAFCRGRQKAGCPPVIPMRPTQRPLVPEQALSFPHPEPPLLLEKGTFSFLPRPAKSRMSPGHCHAPAPHQ
jgi:hypothetical protein